jgi:hypothetical protein
MFAQAPCDCLRLCCPIFIFFFELILHKVDYLNHFLCHYEVLQVSEVIQTNCKILYRSHIYQVALTNIFSVYFVTFDLFRDYS